MTHDEFKTMVYGAASEAIPQISLHFALEFYLSLEKMPYFQNDVADCLNLARRVHDQLMKDKVESRLLSRIDILCSQITDVAQFKESINALSGSLSTIRKAIDEKNGKHHRGPRGAYKKKE